MSNAFADIQTVYKTNDDYSSVNSNIHFIDDDDDDDDHSSRNLGNVYRSWSPTLGLR